MKAITPRALWAAISIVAGLGAALHGQLVAAQGFPNKPLHLVVPNTAGSPPDIVARIIGPPMSKVLGQAIIVEPKPGANTIIGHEYVAKAAPDGYNFAIVSVSGLALLPITVANLRFDALADLPPFIGLVESKYAFISSTKTPWNSVAELVANARANPGKLNYGASAPSVRLPVEILLQEYGLNVVHIPYTSGGGPYFQALASGEVQMGFVAESVAKTLADRVKVLAVTGRARSANFPNAPTFTDLGIAQIAGFSFSLNLPAATPKDVVDKLYAAAADGLA